MIKMDFDLMQYHQSNIGLLGKNLYKQVKAYDEKRLVLPSVEDYNLFEANILGYLDSLEQLSLLNGNFDITKLDIFANSENKKLMELILQISRELCLDYQDLTENPLFLSLTTTNRCEIQGVHCSAEKQYDLERQLQ